MIDNLVVVTGVKFLHYGCYLGLPENGGDQYFENSLAPDTHLVALKDDERWPAITPKLIEIIKKKPCKHALFLIHMWSFNRLKWNRDHIRTHCRFEKCEDELRDKLYRKKVGCPERLNIFGVHFEQHTTLSSALELVRDRPGEFHAALLKVLNGADEASLFERLSVVKHRIVGLFLPLDLTLQNWAEDRDPRLRAEVDARLHGKLEGAHRLLKDACRIIEEGGRRADVGKVQALLEVTQVQAETLEAASFHAWINKLDHALDEMRKAVVS